MPQYTPRRGLIKPQESEIVSIAQLNDNMDKLDSEAPLVCTSSTRPSSPYIGQLIYETDNQWTRRWDGQYWLPLESTVFRYNDYGNPGRKSSLKSSEGVQVMHKFLMPKFDFPVLLNVAINWIVELKPQVTADYKIGLANTKEDYNNNTEAAAGSLIVGYIKNHDIANTNTQRRYAAQATASRELYPTQDYWGLKLSAEITGNGTAGTADALVSINEYGYFLQVWASPFTPNSTKLMLSANTNIP